MLMEKLKIDGLVFEIFTKRSMIKNKGHYYKNLRVVDGRLRGTILIDGSPQFCTQPERVISFLSFLKQFEDDRVLLILKEIISQISINHLSTEEFIKKCYERLQKYSRDQEIADEPILSIK